MGSVVSIQIKQDLSEEVLKALEKQIELGMRSIGAEAVGHAVDGCPVDTGRLRASLTYATSENSGGGDSAPQGSPEKRSVYVGTNVEYAIYNEYGHKTKKHFIKNSLTNYSGDYANIMQAALSD